MKKREDRTILILTAINRGGFRSLHVGKEKDTAKAKALYFIIVLKNFYLFIKKERNNNRPFHTLPSTHLTPL